jgi:hypothetical protein
MIPPVEKRAERWEGGVYSNSSGKAYTVRISNK